MPNLVLYAPNIHTGGGYVLLNALLLAYPADLKLRAFLDERARQHLTLPEDSEIFWVSATIQSRIQAERKLKNLCGQADIVLCFHGLPPLFPNTGKVVVFQQNRIYLGSPPLSDFPLRTALRLAYERLVSRACRHRVKEYIVQTPTMARDVRQWHNSLGKSPEPLIRALPFVDKICPEKTGRDTLEWDFIYVADGVAHKNHHRLLEAWRELGQQGLKPRLALTLGKRDADLAARVDDLRKDENLKIYNLGHLHHEQILRLYGRSRALIFPSMSESFGLPLIEATACGLPIIASELDFVRDVCEPVQTFDPSSTTSIARAVRRFLGTPDPIVKLNSPAEFWTTLLASH